MEARVSLEQYDQATISTSNLSELELALGDMAAAVRDAERSVAFANKLPSDWQTFIVTRTPLADAWHQAGKRADALGLFREAEAIQAQGQPVHPLLYSLWGFRYCDLLLSDVERKAWATSLASGLAATDRAELQPPLDALHEVEQRATQTLKLAEQDTNASLLDIALYHLTLGQVALYRAILEDSLVESVREPLTAAVDGLRAAGAQEFIPGGLLSRAWLHFMEGDSKGAKTDLDDAWQIAERGAMKLHMADIHLHRARLFRDRTALEAAAKLIEETGYHRRDEDLADAREALGSPAE